MPPMGGHERLALYGRRIKNQDGGMKPPMGGMKRRKMGGGYVMLLITEVNDNVNLITEEVNGEKQYHIDGIFMQAEQKNRNGRVYPQKTLMNEVQKYNNEYVKTNEQWENSDTLMDPN